MNRAERRNIHALIVGLARLYGPSMTSPAIAHAVSLVTGEELSPSTVRKVMGGAGLRGQTGGRPKGSRSGSRPEARRQMERRRRMRERNEPTLREQHQDLKERHESVLRAAIRLLAAYDPMEPEEAANLVSELGRAAGLSSQNEAQSIVRQWGVPIRTGDGERIPQVMSSGGVRIR